MLGFAIPTYNREKLLQQLVTSISVKYPVYISDNSTTIHDLEFFESYPLVKISPCTQLLPMFENWNRAAACVDEIVTHVVIPSDDDLYITEKINHIENAIAQNPEIDIFIFGCDYIDEYDRVSRGYLPETTQKYMNGDGFFKFIHGVDARMPGVIFRKEFFNKLNGFNQKYKLTASDSELVQKALLLGNSMFVSETVGYYRIWSGSLTSARQASMDWLNEVSTWTANISRLIEQSANQKISSINVKKFAANIYVTNLLSGYHSLVKKDPKAAREFLKSNFKIWNVSMGNVLRQIKYYFLSM